MSVCKVCNDDGYIEEWDSEGWEIVAVHDCPHLGEDHHPAFGASGIFDDTDRSAPMPQKEHSG